MAGVTGLNLLRLLETRLDNVVYRVGFAASRRDARQLVSHGHLTVNGRPVNIPSYAVRVGDVIAIKDSSKEVARIKNALDAGERSEEHTSELQSPCNLVCRLLLEKKKK